MRPNRAHHAARRARRAPRATRLACNRSGFIHSLGCGVSTRTTPATVFPVPRSIELRDPPPVRVANEHVGRLDIRVREKLIELLHHVVDRPRRRARVAPAEAGAVVAHHPRQLGEPRLNLRPAQRRARERGIEHDRRGTATYADNVQPRSFDGDELSRRWMEPTLTPRRDAVIKRARVRARRSEPRLRCQS